MENEYLELRALLIVISLLLLPLISTFFPSSEDISTSNIVPLK